MKYILITIGIIISLPLCIWVIGMFLPESHSATISKTYDASPNEIYSLITDIKGYPSWRSNVKKVELLNGEEQSGMWREFYMDNDPLTFRILEAEDSTKLVTEIADRNLPFGGTWTYQIEALNNGTRLTITEDGEVYNPFFRFVSKFLIGHESTINRFLDDVEKNVLKGL